MKLTLEKGVKVAVEVDGELIVSSDNGSLYQSMDDKEILLYIKNEETNKEVKIKIIKNDVDN